MRPANDECYEICKLCCSYLNDGFSSEKGLFRTNLSQTDVRVLQSQLANNPNSVNRIKEESDPHLVAEVLLVCFRDMVYPLFYEVYDDIVNTGKYSVCILQLQ